MTKESADEYGSAETKRRMEDGLRRALTTPHKPLDKFKGKSSTTGKRKRKANGNRSNKRG